MDERSMNVKPIKDLNYNKMDDDRGGDDDDGVDDEAFKVQIFSSRGGDGGDLVEAAAMEAAQRQDSAVMCCGRCWRSAGSPPLYIGLGGASNSPPTDPRS